MKTNYHTHTFRCGHASSESERAYIEAAISQGFRVLGFADHVPQPYTNFRSGMRMQPKEAEEYVSTLAALREEYRGEIDIHIGFEAEYFPTLFDDLLRLLEPLDYEYLILGQHYLGSEMESGYMAMPTDDTPTLIRFVDHCTEALHTGAFSYMAHPDIFHYVGDEGIYRAQMRRLCREAKACGIPLEYNLLGLGTRRHYPTPAFWEEAAAVGNKVILGWDAHDSQWLTRSQLEIDAIDYLDRLGLSRVDCIPLIRPHAGS